jgi:hypothetical protein
MCVLEEGRGYYVFMGFGWGVEGYLCRVEGWVYVRVHYTGRRKPTPGYGRPDLWCTGARATRRDTVTTRAVSRATTPGNQSQAVFHTKQKYSYCLFLCFFLYSCCRLPLHFVISYSCCASALSSLYLSLLCHPLLLLPLPLLYLLCIFLCYVILYS